MPGRRALLSGLVVVALLAATVAASYLAYDSERDDAQGGRPGARRPGRRRGARRRRQPRFGAEGRLGDRRQGRRHRSGPVSGVCARGDRAARPPLAFHGPPGSTADERAAFEADLGRPITPAGARRRREPARRLERHLSARRGHLSRTRQRGAQFLGLDTLSDPTRAEAARRAIQASAAAALAAAEDRSDRRDRDRRCTRR